MHSNQYADKTVFDIETSVIPNLKDYLGEIKAPSNYKNPEKIAEYLDKAMREEADKAALDVDLLRIVAIGWMDEGTDTPLAYIAEDEAAEAKMLERFWRRMKSKLGGPKTLVGFNILDFDVVALLRRSLYLKVQPLYYSVDRYRHDRIIDLMQLLSYNGKLKYRTLDFYCKRFGIEVTDPVRGADIPGLVAMKDWPSVIAHVKADVLKEYRLAEALGVIDGTKQPAAPAPDQPF